MMAFGLTANTIYANNLLHVVLWLWRKSTFEKPVRIKCPSRPLVVTSGVGTTSTFPCGWEIYIIDVFLDHYSAYCGTAKGAITAHIWTSPNSSFYFPWNNQWSGEIELLSCDCSIWGCYSQPKFILLYSKWTVTYLKVSMLFCPHLASEHAD